MSKTVIVDYGLGNLASVKKSLDFLKISSIISSKPEDIINANHIILPGVGSFKQGMDNLNHFNLINVLNDEVLQKKKPVFGICLGMQLMAEYGTEPIFTKGLGWINGKVIKMEEKDNRIPHLGWNSIKTNKNTFKGFNEKDFYFIHSYHLDIKDPENIIAIVNYGRDYVAAIQKNNIFATQFHPEKSQDIGLKLIKTFFDIYA